jgi:hypothetical protein
MISITDEALGIIRKRAQPVYLELPKRVTGCCFHIQECPSVRFGKPREISKYNEKTIQGVPLLVPNGLPEDRPLTLTVSRFLGISKLVVDGWRLI